MGSEGSQYPSFDAGPIESCRFDQQGKASGVILTEEGLIRELSDLSRCCSSRGDGEVGEARGETHVGKMAYYNWMLFGPGPFGGRRKIKIIQCQTLDGRVTSQSGAKDEGAVDPGIQLPGIQHLGIQAVGQKVRSNVQA